MESVFWPMIASHSNSLQTYVYSPRFLGNELVVATVKLIDLLNFSVVLVSVLVVAFCFRIIAKFNYRENKESAKNDNHNSLLEAAWTITPSIMIRLTRLPSFSLLYLIDGFHQYERSLKVVGNQWYWEYELETPGYSVDVDAGLLTIEDLTTDFHYYRLACTSAILLPVKTYVRALISSNDVLHSWAIPTLGVKMDACPGRSNEFFVKSEQLGSFFGQCSEFCGRFHGYRPIELRFSLV